MKITILGAGGVGTTLGGRLQAAGHSIVYAVRDPAETRHEALRETGAAVHAAPEAVALGDVVLLTVPWKHAEAALADLDFGGRILVDATNPIGPGFALTHGGGDSGAEQVARWAPTARVVKAFNSTGRENMAAPSYPGGDAFMPICGDEPDAVATVVALARDVGFEAVGIGGLDRARLVEPLALLWIRMAFGTDLGRGFAFGLLRRG